MKKNPLVILAFLWRVTIPITAEPVDSTQFAGWTDEQYSLYEDSILSRLYPPVTVAKADSTMAAVLPPTITEESTDASLIPIVTLDRTKAVGQIPIYSETTPSGARTYQVPIDVYKSPRGITPQIAITYNSQQGLSCAGMGWSLSGLSVIARTNKSLYYDKTTDAVRMNNSDAFTLDGVRLIRLTSAGDSITYESETGKVKAVAHTIDNVISYFDIYWPDGRHGIFGYLGNTQNQLSYPVVSLTDLWGNGVQFDYIKENNLYHISKISYGNASIAFNYMGMDVAVRASYSGGLQCMTSKLIQDITCWLGTSELKKYSLTYSEKNVKAVLTRIDLNAGGKSVNPLLFQYGTGTMSNTYNTTTSQLAEWYVSESPSSIRMERGKFDYASTNDGLIALPSLNPYWKHYRHSTSLRHSQNRFDNYYTGDERIYVYTSLENGFILPGPDMKTGKGFVDIFCADLDGSREDRIVKVNNVVEDDRDKLTFTVYNSVSYSILRTMYARTFTYSTVYTDADGGKSIQPKYFYAGDFNGDGRMEVLAMSVHQPFGDTTKPSMCYVFDLENGKQIYNGHILNYNIEFVGTQQSDPNAAANNSDRLLAMDFDGDGKTDLCHITSAGTTVYTFDVSGNTLLPRKVGSFTSLKRSSLKDRDILSGDYNGDGLSDLLITSENGTYDSQWQLYCSKGDGTFCSSLFHLTTATPKDSINFIAQDINGDGRTDILRNRCSTGFETFLSQKTLLSPTTQTSYASGLSILVPTDINGHNNSSQLVSVLNGVVTKYSFTNNDSKELLLTAMTNSLGVTEQTTYKHLNEGLDRGILYNRGTSVKFPYGIINEPLTVVAETATYVGGKKTDGSRFYYEDGVYHSQGLGFCGFAKITRYDSRERAHTQSFDPFCHGFLKSETTPEKETSYDYTYTTRADRIFYVTKTISREKNLANGTGVSTSTDYDTFGNATKEAVTYSDGIQVTTESTWLNTVTVGQGYSLGFLTDQTVTVKRNGRTYTERMFVVNHAHHLPYLKFFYKNGSSVKQQVYSYDKNWEISADGTRSYSGPVLYTKYTRDAYGRVTKSVDALSMTTEYSYDTNGLLASQKDYKGTTTFSYDEFGREILVQMPDGTVKTTQYAWGKTESDVLFTVTQTAVDRKTTSKGYDAFGREVSDSYISVAGKAIETKREYDSYGRLSRVSLPSQDNLWTVYGYDRFDRVISIKEPSGRETAYDYNGYSTTITTDSVTTVKKYDSLGVLVSTSDAGGTVEFDLDADGQPLTVSAPTYVITSYTYDTFRRVTSIDDPSRGLITYTYDAAGNVKTQTNAAGQVTEYTYDSYLRMIKKATSELTVSYTYDDNNAIRKISTNNGFSKTYTYDAFGRVSGVHELFRDTWLHKDITYRNGKENTVQYTSQMGVLATENYKYNNGFFFEGWINGQTRIISSPVRNAFGQPTDVWTGDIQHHYGYTQFGYPVKYAAVGKQGRQYAVTTLHFNAATSNLTLRKDGIRDITERFVYDNLNRLVAYGKHQAEYASNGNLIRKSDVGEFLYNAKSNPYALTNNIRYNSVANDRMQEVDYYSFHRPMSVTENGYTFDFNYNDNFDRVQTTLLHDNKSVREKRFFCDRYEWVQDSTGIEERLYLFGDYYQSPAILVRKGGEIKLNYLLRDHLGSVTHVIDANGTVLQELSYDAWGQLRNPETYVTYRQGKAPEPLFERGYCGHEHLEPFGLVNMNARLYDSVLGRFLSPDPFVQQKDNSQNYNSYSYCMNNPLKYVDKSGKLFGFSLLWGLLETVYNVATHGLAFKHYSYRKTVNALRIDMGMFKGSLGQVLNKWTWGASNSFVGNTIAHALNVAGQVDGVTHMAGMLALSGTTQGEAAFTIGHYSFGPLGYQADWRDHLFVHEYGHYIQSQQLGGAYFQIVAIPSLISASGMFGKGNHKYRWYEVNASKLGAEYFDKKYGAGADGYQIDSPDYFDINAFHDGGTTPYTNPRTGKRSQREHPITGIRHSAWDFLLPIALPVIIPTAWLTIEPIAHPILQPFLFF